MLWTIAFIVQTRHGQIPPRLPNYERHVTCWCEKCDEQELPIGDVFWIVQIGGEGSATVWHRGRMFGSSIDYFQECDKPSPSCSGLKQQRGIRQWWIKVRNARGQIGWARADWNFIDDSCGVPHGR